MGGGPSTCDMESDKVDVLCILCAFIGTHRPQASWQHWLIFWRAYWPQGRSYKGPSSSEDVDKLLGRALEEQPAFISGGHASEPNPGRAKKEDAVVLAFGGHTVSLRGWNPFRICLCFTCCTCFLPFYYQDELWQKQIRYHQQVVFSVCCFVSQLVLWGSSPLQAPCPKREGQVDHAMRLAHISRLRQSRRNMTGVKSASPWTEEMR